MTDSFAIIKRQKPGQITTGFAENMLAHAITIKDPDELYRGTTSLAGLAQQWNGFPKEKIEIKTAQMFVEIALGQLLGPAPGVGTRTDLDDDCPRTDGLPKQRAADFRRYYGWQDRLFDAVREGTRSRRSLLLKVDQWSAVDVSVDELDIRKGDFREVLNDIPDKSVDLILTDPPYPMEYLPLWDALGEWASSRLIDGGSLVAYCGQSILPDALERLGSHLRYWWTLSLIHRKSQMMSGKNVSIGWKPLIWFVKDRRRDEHMLPDRLHGSEPRKTVPTGDDGTWAQGVEELEPIISGLTAPDELVVDPFAGSGTTGIAARRFGRKFIGATL